MKSQKEKYRSDKIVSLTLQRLVTILLGLLWLIDGILQFQPEMFTKAFVTNILAPNLQGQPFFITNIIQFGIHLFSMNYLFTNLGSAVVQVLIGLALILPVSKRYQRIALYISIAWSLVVWILGEGLGNILTGMASFYTGVPGSVTLYLILAVFLLYPKRFSLTNLPKAAGILFLFGAFLNVLPMFWTKEGIQMLFQFSSADTIKAIAAPATYLSNVMSSSPVISNDILVLLLGFFGVQLLLKPKKIIVWSMVIFLVFVWWLCQDLGGIQTFPGGTATDPNSAPLFILFLLPLFYTKNWNINVSKYVRKNKMVANFITKFIAVSTAVASMLALSFIPAYAHVIVHPNQVGIAATQEFTITMPNEKHIPTVALRLLIPKGVIEVLPNETPNWNVSEKIKNNNVTEIDWTNGNLPVGQRVDFLFQAQVPPTPTTLDWKTYQTYSDGEVVSWDQSPQPTQSMDMKQMDFSKYGPYSTTQVINDLTGSQSMTDDTTNNTVNMALGISILAGVLAVIAIGMLLKEKMR